MHVAATALQENWKGSSTIRQMRKVRRMAASVPVSDHPRNYCANASAPFILGTGKTFNIIWASPDANREVVLNYVKAKKDITRVANGSTSSWRFAKLAATAGKVLFKSGKDELGLAQAAGLTNISVDKADDTGVNNGTGAYTVYRIDLSQ